MGSGFAKKKKEAKRMQEQFMKMQQQLKDESVEGSSGGGLVKIVLNGEHEMKRITIHPDCIDPEDVEGLQDLIQAAYHDALKKLEDKMPDLSQGLPGGLGGLGLT